MMLSESRGLLSNAELATPPLAVFQAGCALCPSYPLFRACSHRPLSDEELDAMLPGPSEGYKILSEPPG